MKFYSNSIRFELMVLMLQLSLIDDDGCFIRETGDEFVGLNVLTDGANKILHHIGENVLHTDMITHSYPYDWRTKKPVIIRASHQWFIDINSIKEAAIVSQSSLYETQECITTRSSLMCSYFVFFTQGQHREYKNISGAKSYVVLECIIRSS